jgi:hypothetical protein
MQIFQFVFGASYAALHLFIKYDVPVSTPFQIAHTIERAVSSASSVGTAATKSASSVASAVSSFAENPYFGPTAAAFLKKLLLRAAGDAGPAERVALEEQRNALLPGQAVPQIEEKIKKVVERRLETRWRTEWTTVNCIDTSGEAFAIYLNLLYLAPLTFLFARFFVRAYTARGRPKSVQQAARTASDATRDAKNQTEYSVEKAGEAVEDKADEDSQRLQEEVRKDLEDFKNGVRNRRISDRIGETVKNYEERVREMVNGKSTSGSGPPSRKSSPSKQPSVSSLKEEGGTDESKDGAKDEPKNGAKDEPKNGAKDEPIDDSKNEPNDIPKVESEDDSKNDGPGTHGLDTDHPSYADAARKAVEDDEEGDGKAESQPTQSGAKEPDEEDTDAMGKSGAIVNPPDSPEPNTSADKGADDESTKSTGNGPGGE